MQNDLTNTFCEIKSHNRCHRRTGATRCSRVEQDSTPGEQRVPTGWSGLPIGSREGADDRPHTHTLSLCLSHTISLSRPARGGGRTWRGRAAQGFVSFGAHLSVCDLISQKVFVESFCKSQFPHKFVNVSFIIANITNKLTNFCGN